MAQQPGKVQLTVSWGRCTDNKWCPFSAVNLGNAAFSAGGVYIVWHQRPKPRVVYVGQASVLRDRIGAHREDEDILAYADSDLRVTWAIVDKAKRDGVEVYLANRYQPLIGDRHPDATPIIVNSPWG